MDIRDSEAGRGQTVRGTGDRPARGTTISRKRKEGEIRDSPSTKRSRRSGTHTGSGRPDEAVSNNQAES